MAREDWSVVLGIAIAFAGVVSTWACRFPSRWSGTWYQKGAHPPIRIDGDTFSFKGVCIAAEGDLFLIEDRRERCVRCVVIYEKHPNVLQYRETFCDEYSSLQDACTALTVDAHLFSLFRVHGDPVPCPFRGPLTFSYSRGHGSECRYPLSTVDACTQDYRLLFRFQACADVMGTESSVEELTCLAIWKEGSSHYMVGKLAAKQQYARLPFVDEENYRCFVFDTLPDKSGYQLSQSADATCDGLVNPWEGSRVMRLTKGKPPTVGCAFPTWVTSPHRWHTLDSRTSYIFGHHRNSTLRIVSRSQENIATASDTKVTCSEEIASSPNTTSIVAYSMAGCDTGFICLTFHRRDRHIVELQVGGSARRSQDACMSPYFDPQETEFTTLVTPSTVGSGCPRLAATDGLRVWGSASHPLHSCGGSSSGTGRTPGENSAVIGCRSHDTLEFMATCSPHHKDRKTFQCHGGWEESGRGYLIAELKGTRTKYCFVYSWSDKGSRLSGLHDTCRRSILPGVTGNLTFNVSAAGACEELMESTSSGRSQFTFRSLLLLIVVLAFPANPQWSSWLRR